MDVGAVKATEDKRQRLAEVTNILGVGTVVQAWGVGEEELEGYISGKVEFGENAVNEGQLRMLEQMCDTAGWVPELGGDDHGMAGVERSVERDAGLVLGEETGDEEDGVEAVGGKAYARFGDAPLAARMGIGAVPEGGLAQPEMVVGLDVDGDGKVDIELPGAVAMPKTGNWNEEMERRRQALWTARSIAVMTQYRLMKRREIVAAMGWVAQIELALISFYGESLPDPAVPWTLQKQSEEIDRRLSRLRWVKEEQEREYNGVKGVARWLVGDRWPSGKELYQKMVEEADKLLVEVDSVGSAGLNVLEAVEQLRGQMGAVKRPR